MVSADTTFEGLRICAVSDRAGVGERCAWHPRKATEGDGITWCPSATLKGLSGLDVVKGIDDAFDLWAEVCRLKHKYNPNYKTADVQMDAGSIDRPGSVLAWSEMPCSPNPGQLQQMYDTNEPWVIGENPPRNKINFIAVCCHEIGHVIGIPHIAGGNLMYNTYSSTIWKPQSGDVAEAVARYGLPRSSPTPPVDPPPDDPGDGDDGSFCPACLALSEKMGMSASSARRLNRHIAGISRIIAEAIKNT